MGFRGSCAICWPSCRGTCRSTIRRLRNTGWRMGFAAGTIRSRLWPCKENGSKRRSGSGGGEARGDGGCWRGCGREVDLRIAGEDDTLIELPLGPEREACCAVERLRDLWAGSVRLRTRALTTTLFARFLVGDLFIHGIGGSKYDELGDEISRRFFGVEPPPFLTVSMTVRVGLSEDDAANELAMLDRRLRTLRHNPERQLSEPYADELRNIIERKYELVGAPVSTRRERKQRCLAIRACNLAMQPWMGGLEADLVARRMKAQSRASSNRAARSREYAYVLHSVERLKRSLELGVRSIVGGSSSVSLASSH